MRMDAKNEAKEFIKRVGEVNLPTLMHVMRLDDEDGKELLWELVGEGFLEHTVGFLFRYTGKEGAPSPETSKPMGLGELFESRRQKTQNAPYRPSFLFDREKREEEEEKEELEPFGKESDEDELPEPREVNLTELFKRRKLSKTAFFFKCNRFEREGGEFFCELGVTYPDDEQMRFKLAYDDGVWLSDCGGTYRYMTDNFRITSMNVEMAMREILSDYSIEERETKEGKELALRIQSYDSAFNSFLWLFSAIERITNLREQSLLNLVTKKYEESGRNKLIELMLEKKLSYTEALAQIRAEHAQAAEMGNEFERSVCTSVLETLVRLTEASYEEFRRSIGGGNDEDDEDDGNDGNDEDDGNDDFDFGNLFDVFGGENKDDENKDDEDDGNGGSDGE